MVSFSQPQGLRKRPQLRQLQEVQEDIYRQVYLLIPESMTFHDHLASRVSGSPVLRMEVIERHPYTTFFRLTYEFNENDVPTYAPDAHIRYYHDAHIAEATSFSVRQGCTRTAHPAYPPEQMLQHSWRLNRALDRWLDYLLRQGHSVTTMKPARHPIKDVSSQPELVTARA
jgi:hypothetical protein